MIYISPHQLWNLGYRSLIILPSDEPESEGVRKLIASFKNLSGQTYAIQGITHLRGQQPIMSWVEDTKPSDTIPETSSSFASTVTSSGTTTEKPSSGKPSQKRKRLTRNEVLKIRTLYEGGLSISQIRRALELPKNTVRYVVLGINYSQIK